MIAAALAAFGASLSMLANALLWLSTGTILLITVLIWKRVPFCLLPVALFPVVFFAYAQFRTPHPSTHDLSCYAGRHVIFRAQLLSELTDLGNGCWRAVVAPYELIFPDTHRLMGKAQLVLDQQPSTKSPDLKLGDYLEARVLVKLPQRQEQPWQFDLRAYLQKQSIFCTATVYGAEFRKFESGRMSSDFLITGQQTVDLIRSKIVQAHTANLGDKAGTLLSSMVLGDKTVTVDPGIISDFRNVGLSHLIAASGFNLAVVATASFWLARCIYPARLFVTGLTLFNMALFVAFAGLSPSVLRAVCMCLVLIAATHFYRSVNGLAAVALALLLTILIDPSSISDPGCQLSFSATIGIICGATYIAELFLPKERLSEKALSEKVRLSGQSFLIDKLVSLATLAKMFSWFVESVSVVICAQASIMPVQLFYFWRVGLLFLPANLIVAPLVTPVTILGFASSFSAPLSFAGKTSLWLMPCKFLDALAAFPLQAILGTANYFASIKQALISFGPPSSLSICFYYLSLSALFFSLRKKRWRMSCFVLFLFAGFLLFWRPADSHLTIAVFSNAIVAFGENHQGICIGERQAKVEKFLAYYGVRVNSDTYGNARVQQGLNGQKYSGYKIESGNHTYSIVIPVQPITNVAQIQDKHLRSNSGYQTLEQSSSVFTMGKSNQDITRLLLIRVPESMIAHRKVNQSWDQVYSGHDSHVAELKQASRRTGKRLSLQNWLKQVEELQTTCGAKFIVLVENSRGRWRTEKATGSADQNLLPELNLIADHNLHACLVKDLSGTKLE